MKTFLKKLFTNIEAMPANPASLFYSFNGIVFLRLLFERMLGFQQQLTTQLTLHNEFVNYVQLWFYFLCVLLFIAAAISLLSKISLLRSLKLCVLASPIILLAPLLDYFFSAGYVSLYHTEIADAGLYFLNMLNPFATQLHITIGARIEMFLVMGIIFLLFKFHLHKKTIVALWAVVITYTIIFISGFMPAIFKNYVLGNEGYAIITQNTWYFALQFVYVWLLACGVCLVAVFINNRKLALYLLSFLYPSRLAFYMGLLFLGFAMGYVKADGVQAMFHFISFTPFLAAAISITLLFAYAKIINDENDIAIDKVSNPQRAVAIGYFSRQQLAFFKKLFLIFSIVFLLLASQGFGLVMIWLAIFALSYLYSVPPFRVRKYFPLGHLSLAVIGWLLYVMGVTIHTPNLAIAITSQHYLPLSVMASFFLLAQFKDAKDVVGDEQNQIKTLFSFIPFTKIVLVLLYGMYTATLVLFLHALQLHNYWLWSGASWLLGMLIIGKAKTNNSYDALLPVNALLLGIVGLFWVAQNW